MRIKDRRLDITNSACGYIINETDLTCQINSNNGDML